MPFRAGHELAAAIMNECAEEFMAAGRATTLAQWCRLIPVDLIVRNPALHASATLALISLHRHEEARALIQRFLEQSPILDDARSARVLALQAFQVVWSDRLDEIDQCLAQAQACEAQLEPVFWMWTLRNCAAYLLLLNNTCRRPGDWRSAPRAPCRKSVAWRPWSTPTPSWR